MKDRYGVARKMDSPVENYFTVHDKVDYFDCDNRSAMRISAALRSMQRCSCEQMIRLGIPLEKLIAEGMSLILTKICIKVHRMPLCNERLVVGTIPVGPVGAKYQREFFMDSQDGERLISAFFYWILVDPDSRQLVRPSKFPYDWDLKPSLIGEVISDIPFPKRAPSGAVRPEITVRYSDMNWNDHVNNTVYADFVCDALVRQIRADRLIDTFSIRFKNESLLGDVVRVSSDILDDGDHYLVGRHDRGVCFEALVRFKKSSGTFPETDAELHS